MIKFFLFFILNLILIYPSIAFEAKVINVSDGDTISVLRNDKTIKIRLSGIDTPELNQSHGKISKQFLSKLISNKIITVKGDKYDRYGRLIGDIYINSLWVNYELVSHGHAWHYKRYSTDQRLSNAEDIARKMCKGLWVDKNPIAPWDFRKNK